MRPSVRVRVIHGPNLNLLGSREPEIYGRETLAEVDQRIRARARELGLEVEILQSNHEGDLVDWVQQAPAAADAVVINPGALAHYSLALRDAVAAVAPRVPVIEVHLTNLYAREPFRQRSVVAAAAAGVITGLGADGYLLALEAARRLVERRRGAAGEA